MNQLRRPLNVTLGIIALLGFAIFSSSGFYIDWLWFKSVGFTSVWSTVLTTKITLFVASGILTSLFISANIFTAYRKRRGDQQVHGAVGLILGDTAKRSGSKQNTGAGVTGVVLNRHGPWTYGLLAYQSWEVGGNPAFGTQNNLYGQPVVAYTNKQAWTFTSNMEALYNYDTRHTSNPLYAGVSKVVVVDGLPFSFGAGPMYYVSNTPGGPSGWGARATVTLIILK